MKVIACVWLIGLMNATMGLEYPINDKSISLLNKGFISITHFFPTINNHSHSTLLPNMLNTFTKTHYHYQGYVWLVGLDIRYVYQSDCYCLVDCFLRYYYEFGILH